MTKEPLYIISGEQVKEIREGCYHEIFNVLNLVESRPLEQEKQAAVNEERAKALKKLTRIQFMVKHAWEGERDTNPPDLGGILKFVEGFIAELRQQSSEQQRGREE